MNFLIKTSLFVLTLIVCFSCQKIDSFMFENIATEDYLLDDYNGDSEVFLDSTFNIQQDNIHQLPYQGHQTP